MKSHGVGGIHVHARRPAAACQRATRATDRATGRVAHDDHLLLQHLGEGDAAAEAYTSGDSPAPLRPSSPTDLLHQASLHEWPATAGSTVALSSLGAKQLADSIVDDGRIGTGFKRWTCVHGVSRDAQGVNEGAIPVTADRDLSIPHRTNLETTIRHYAGGTFLLRRREALGLARDPVDQRGLPERRQRGCHANRGFGRQGVARGVPVLLLHSAGAYSVLPRPTATTGVVVVGPPPAGVAAGAGLRGGPAGASHPRAAGAAGVHAARGAAAGNNNGVDATPAHVGAARGVVWGRGLGRARDSVHVLSPAHIDLWMSPGGLLWSFLAQFAAHAPPRTLSRLTSHTHMTSCLLVF